jgi:hypothetical protein
MPLLQGDARGQCRGAFQQIPARDARLWWHT